MITPFNKINGRGYAITTLVLIATYAGGNTLLGIGAGAKMWTGTDNTLIGERAGRGVTSGTNNTMIGANTGVTQSSSDDCTFIGARAGNLNTASDSTFIGVDAGAKNTTGNDNTFIGETSGFSNSTGDSNVFVGIQAGHENTDGNDNTFLGANSGYSNLTGLANTFAGGRASTVDVTLPDGVVIKRGLDAAGYDNLASFNTFCGAGAGVDNGDGVANTMLGYGSGYGNEHADCNTFVGTNAGYHNNITNSLTNANRNTYLGFKAGFSNREGEDNLGIGANSGFTGTDHSRSTFIGSESIVGANDCIAIGYQASATADNSTAIGNHVSVSSPNEVVIGNSAVTSIGGTVNWTATSDGRLKFDVCEDVPGLRFIEALRPVTYHADAEKLFELNGTPVPKHLRAACESKSKIKYSGFIAQEVQQAAKAIGFDFSGVRVPETPEAGAYGLRYAELVVPLVKSVQELHAQLEDPALLEEQIRKQSERIKAQQKLLERYERILLRISEE